MPSIGEAARRSGVPVETIRYYERAGILPGPQRSESGHRVYDAAGIARLRLIKRCRDLGFSLSDAQGLLALSENNAASCTEVEVIAKDHLAEVRRKISDLRDLEGALAELIRDCAEGNPACPVLRALAGRR
jgi:MerR family mercuric resistance operon transcriptional regulator